MPRIAHEESAEMQYYAEVQYSVVVRVTAISFLLPGELATKVTPRVDGYGCEQ
jgi:hypothetical protein